MVRIGTGAHTYDWNDNWAAYPVGEGVAEGWVHPGTAWAPSGRLYTSHPTRSEILAYDMAGRHLAACPVPVVEVHNLLLADDGGREVLWVSDNGARRTRAAAYEYDRTVPAGAPPPGQVLKIALDGTVLLRLDMPALPEYAEARWSPTAVAVDEERLGGNGDVWVADGYGQSLVHHYDRAGRHRSTLTGETGAGRFNCPHGIFIDRREAAPRLLVADRANSRIQAYALDGTYLSVFGQDVLKRPSCFAVCGDDLIIGDLSARLTILDVADRLVCHLGDNSAVCSQPGWPNSLDGAGARVRSCNLAPGRFNSPHGLAADQDGNLYVAEWGIGARLVKLERCR